MNRVHNAPLFLKTCVAAIEGARMDDTVIVAIEGADGLRALLTRYRRPEIAVQIARAILIDARDHIEDGSGVGLLRDISHALDILPRLDVDEGGLDV